MASRDLEVARIKKDWAENSRLKGVKRGFTAGDVYRLRGGLQVEHRLARKGANSGASCTCAPS
jgi:isocitrate lyase